MSNTLYVGGSAVDKVYLGGVEADSVYLGDTKVWSAAVPVTVTASVAASADDGLAQGSTLTTTIGLTVQGNATGHYGFARFSGLAVPKGATITAAKLTISSYFGGYAAISCTLRAAAADNPSTPVTAAAVTSAATTTSNVAWSTGGATPTAPTDSPDLTAIVQEIVNRAAWTSGNAILFIAACNAGTAITRAVDKAETLSVTYTT